MGKTEVFRCLIYLSSKFLEFEIGKAAVLDDWIKQFITTVVFILFQVNTFIRTEHESTTGIEQWNIVSMLCLCSKVKLYL